MRFWFLFSWCLLKCFNISKENVQFCLFYRIAKLIIPTIHFFFCNNAFSCTVLCFSAWCYSHFLFFVAVIFILILKITLLTSWNRQWTYSSASYFPSCAHSSSTCKTLKIFRYINSAQIYHEVRVYLVNCEAVSVNENYQKYHKVPQNDWLSKYSNFKYTHLKKMENLCNLLMLKKNNTKKNIQINVLKEMLFTEKQMIKQNIHFCIFSWEASN